MAALFLYELDTVLELEIVVEVSMFTFLALGSE